MKRGWRLALVAAAIGVATQVSSQSFSNLDRDRLRDMLVSVRDDTKSYYYDPTYHGVNLDAEFRAAEERVKHAESYGQGFGAIAQALNLLNDSHTFFIPPMRSARVHYGWEMQMIGERCYITQVQPKSDAEAKGLKPGDLLLAVNGIAPARDNLWKLRDLF